MGAQSVWFALLAALPLSRAASADEVRDPLPFESSLRDPVFSVLVGLIRTDSEGSLSGDHLRREIDRRPKKSRLPAHLLASLDRQKTAGEAARVSLTLKSPMNLPIPYSILWYHPGRMQASAQTLFEERALGPLRIDHVARGEPRRALEVAAAWLFLLERGGLGVDIHGWLDRLLGASLDDADVHTVALVSFQGRWLGIALGRNPSGQPRHGAFDIEADKVLFPIPAEIRSIVRAVRAKADELKNRGRGRTAQPYRGSIHRSVHSCRAPARLGGRILRPVRRGAGER